MSIMGNYTPPLTQNSQSTLRDSWEFFSAGFAGSAFNVICGRSSGRRGGFTVELPAFRDEPLEQRRRFPIVTESRAVFLDARQHGVQTDRLGVEHRAAAVPREAEAVHVDDVD